MTLALTRGDVAHDYSWARPNLAALQALGCKAIVRYLSTDTTGKNITAAELDECARLGLGVILVWELYQARIVKTGAAGGAEDVSRAVAQARNLPGGYTYPAGATIIFANDIDTTAADLPNVYGYFDAVRAGIGEYLPGVYCEFEVLEALVWAGYKFGLNWQCSAWSGRYTKMITDGNVWFEPAFISDSADALQIVGSSVDTTSFGGGTDENHWRRAVSNIWVPGQTSPPVHNDDVGFAVVYVTGTKATFIGETYVSPITGITLVPRMEWVNGEDPNEKARFDALVPHLPKMEIGLDACLNITVDRVPRNDGMFTGWSRSHFGHVTSLDVLAAPVDVNGIAAAATQAVLAQLPAAVAAEVAGTLPGAIAAALDADLATLVRNEVAAQVPTKVELVLGR